jgi:hypothetical protein
LSKQDIVHNLDTIISENGADIMITERASDGDIQELVEVLELYFSKSRNMAKGTRQPMAMVPLGSLIGQRNKLQSLVGGQSTQTAPQQDPFVDAQNLNPNLDLESAVTGPTLPAGSNTEMLGPDTGLEVPVAQGPSNPIFNAVDEQAAQVQLPVYRDQAEEALLKAYRNRDADQYGRTLITPTTIEFLRQFTSQSIDHKPRHKLDFNITKLDPPSGTPTTASFNLTRKEVPKRQKRNIAV